ncbi:MAG: OmpA family protein [Crocinitomicaceae bacterium]
MKKLFILLAVFSTTMIVAQEQEGENMLENGSFESIDGKVKKLGDITKAVGWTSPTAARPDLFIPDNKILEIDPKTNPYGSETAKDGENFAGIVAYSYNNKIPRTYLMAKLNEPMKKGMKYCVNMYISLAELSKYACNNIGINFSSKEFSSTEKVALLDEFSVIDLDNKVFNATFNWDRICGTYTAKGGERYITIGNFETDEATKNERVKKSADLKGTQIIAAYYYVDDIKVQLLNKEEVCDCGTDKGINLGSAVIYSKNDYFKEDMTVAQKIDASTIYFGFVQDMITGASKVDLNRLVALMKADPTLRLKVVGHSDVKESELATTKPAYAGMSQKRINMTIKYFIDNGIDASRLIASDGGDRTPSPSADVADEELKEAKNRRVEFVLYK